MIEKYLDRQYEYLMGLDKKSPKNPKRKFPFWILAAIIMAIAIIYFSSCNSQKHLGKEKQSVDSSYVKELQDSVRVLTQTNEHLEKTISEMQYAGVSFDTVWIAGKTDTITNTVTITKEGDITAKGKILSAYVSKNLLTKIVNEKQSTIDSFALALEKEKKNVKIETQVKTVEKEVKTGSFPWLWIVAMFIFGAFLWDRLKPKFIKLLKI